MKNLVIIILVEAFVTYTILVIYLFLENDEDQDNSFIPKFACNFTDSESDDDTPAIPKFNGTVYGCHKTVCIPVIYFHFYILGVNSSLDKLFDTSGSEEYKSFCTPTVQEGTFIL